MNKNNHASKSTNWWGEIAWHLLIPVLFVTAILLFYPYRTGMRDFDEGINVIKGLLVNEGYELYKEIWNDQPPLYTYMLSTLYSFAGYSLAVSRLSTIFLSGMLMWACVQYLRFTWGNLTAVVGAFLLFLLPMYNSLSAKIMVGLPAIAFAMVSVLFITLWHMRRRKVWLVLAGLFLGLSTLTKLFTGLLAPIFLIGLLADEYPHLKNDRNGRRFLQPAVIWGLSFSAVIIFAVLVFIKLENLTQLIAPHLSAREIDVFQAEEFTISHYMKAVLDLILLALLGLIIGLWRKSWLTLYPGAWMVTAYILLSRHAPVWAHQHLLVTVPATMLASIAVGDAIRFLFLKQKKWKADWLVVLLRVIPLIVIVRYCVVYFPIAIQDFDLHPQIGLRETSSEIAVLSKMNDYADETHWIVTDLPIFAFWLRKPVPPELAVFTSKRLRSGNLTEQEVIDVIIAYKPEQVMLGRFEMHSVYEYLDENYQQVYDKNQYVLYVRPDLTGGG